MFSAQEIKNRYVCVSSTDSSITPLMRFIIDSCHEKGPRAEEFERLLEKDNVCQANKDGITALHYAVANKTFAHLQKIIDKGADVDAEDNAGWTPLMVAMAGHEAIDDDTKLIRMLLNNGASNCNKSNLSALDVARYYGYKEGIERIEYRFCSRIKFSWDTVSNASETSRLMTMLILREPSDQPSSLDGEIMSLIESDSVENLDRSSIDQITALHIAASKGTVALVNALLKRGVKIDPVNTHLGATPLIMALRVNTVIGLQVAELLIKNGANINHTSANSKRPLDEAILSGATRCFELLLEKGCEINYLSGEPVTPLARVIDYGRGIDGISVQRLLDNNANPNLVGKNKLSALLMAADYDNTAMTKILLEKKADPNLSSEVGDSPLLIAIINNNTEMVKVLIKNKADVNFSNPNRQTPLHEAAKNGNFEITSILLQHGAKINVAPEDNGLTPLGYACALGHSKIVEAMLARKAEIDTPDKRGFVVLHIAARGKHPDCVKLLIKHTKRIDAQENEGETPLMISVEDNAINIARLLVEAGANIHIKSKYGYPLHRAIAVNSLEMTELLLENEASLNELSSKGLNALKYAIEFKSLDMIKLILKYKSRMNIHQNTMKNHVDFAREVDSFEAIPLLEKELKLEPAIKPPSPPKKEKKLVRQPEIQTKQISAEEQAKLEEDEAKRKEEDRLKRQAEEEKRTAEEAKLKDAKKRELEVKKAKETLVKQAFNEIYDSLSKFTSSKGATKDFFKGGMRKTAESIIDSQDKEYVQNETNIVDRLMLAQDILSSTGMKKTNPKLFEDLKQQFADTEKSFPKPASPTEIKTNDPISAHAEPMPESQDDQKALNKLLHEHEKLQNAKAAEARKKQASSSTSAPLLMAPQSQAEAEQIRKLVYDLVLLVTPYQDQTQRSLLEMKYDIVKMDVIVSQLNKTAGKRMMEALFANTEELSIIRNGALHLLEIHSEHQHFSQEQINHFFENFYRTILERVSILATLDIQPDTRLSHTLSRIQGQSPLQLRDILAQMAAPELAHETYKQFEVNYRNHQLNKDNARSDVNEDIQNRIGILAHSAENNLSRPERVMLAVEIAELYRQRGNAGLKHGFMPYALIEARHEFAHHGINIPDELIHELLTEYQSMTLKYK
jgi:ankyrin repeat protein